MFNPILGVFGATGGQPTGASPAPTPPPVNPPPNPPTPPVTPPKPGGILTLGESIKDVDHAKWGWGSALRQLWPSVLGTGNPNAAFLGERGVIRNLVEAGIGSIQGKRLESAGKPYSLATRWGLTAIPAGATLYAALSDSPEAEKEKLAKTERGETLGEALKVSRGGLVRGREGMTYEDIAQVRRMNPSINEAFETLHGGQFPEAYQGGIFGPKGAQPKDREAAMDSLAIRLARGEADPAKAFNAIAEMMALKDAEIIEKERSAPGPDGVTPSGKSTRKPWKSDFVWLPVSLKASQITNDEKDNREVAVGIYRPKQGPARAIFEELGGKEAKAWIDKFGMDDKPAK